MKLRLLLLAIAITAPLTLAAQASYSWEADLHHRLLRDFCRTHDEVKTYIQRYVPDITEEEMLRLEGTRAIETMTLDGQKRYFSQAGSNLFRIDPAYAAIKLQKDGIPRHTPEAGFTFPHDGYECVDATNIPAIIHEAPKNKHHLAEPKNLKVRYTLTVKADAVPAGTTIRCWLPFPQTDNPRQTKVKLLSTSEKKYIRSNNNISCHSTLYMEKKAVAGQPTVFSEEFSYWSSGYWTGLRPELVQPYDSTTQNYALYTVESPPHIVFTPRIRHLADSLTAGEQNPLLRARRIFKWINDNFPWASAREYSTIPCIPEYVLDNHHGDCGQVSLLFITLCRAAGIPAHFESGFMMHPGYDNLHDWAEVYFEGVGWVPADQSFGIPAIARQPSVNAATTDIPQDDLTYFFLGGIDSWRMVVNSDYGMPLYPAKRYPRSETVDFQRGEVETDLGNLYFDQWSWKLEIVP